MLNATKIGNPAGSSPGVAVVYKLRDHSVEMVKAWEVSFALYPDSVEISKGDIFKGAPQADALVSPANSFGFMDGGIDMAYSMHFGWQMMERLQEEIQTKKDGELLVGDALIIPCYPDAEAEKEARAKVMDVPEWSVFNEGRPIKYLISVPTMRTPQDVNDTVNTYLAFRAVILAVKRHNSDSSKEPIRSVLCPGLGTAVGRMPKPVAAKQMLLAYETFQLGMHKKRLHPENLHNMCIEEQEMKEVWQTQTDETVL